MTKIYREGRYTFKVTVTCGGKPLEGPYIPPPYALEALGRFLASRYGEKDAQLPGFEKLKEDGKHGRIAQDAPEGELVQRDG